MNKTTKGFLILGLTLLLTGLLLGGVGLVSASGQLRDGLGEELLGGLTVGERLELRFEREFAGEVRALEIDSGVANLRLLESPDGRCYLVAEGLREDEVETLLEDGTLTVRERLSISRLLGIHIGPLHIGPDGLRLDDNALTNVLTLTLYLPQRELEALTLNLDVGTTQAQLALHAGKLELNSGVGEVNLASLTADEANIRCGVGNFTLDTGEFESLCLKGGVGECQLRSLTAGNVQIHCDVGRVRLQEGRLDRLELEGGVAEAELRSVTVAQEARIQGGTGNLELEDCQLTNASFYMGVGELRMQGWLKGQSYMEQGIGTVTLELDNAAEESFVSVETGIGDVRIYQGGATQWQGGGISGQGCAYGDEEAADRLTVQGGLGSLRIYLQ